MLCTRLRLRDIDATRAFAAVSGGPQHDNWLIQMAAENVVADMTTHALMNLWPLKGQQLMVSAPQIVAQLCIRAASLIRQIFGFGKVFVLPSDPLWTCMKGGSTAIVLLRSFQLPLAKPQSEAKCAALHTSAVDLVAKFCDMVESTAQKRACYPFGHPENLGDGAARAHAGPNRVPKPERRQQVGRDCQNPAAAAERRRGHRRRRGRFRVSATPDVAAQALRSPTRRFGQAAASMSD